MISVVFRRFALLVMILSSLALGAAGTALGQGPGFGELQDMALRGNVAAQYRLGKIFYEGDGVDRDLPEAADWFRQAADQGDPDAAWYLGKMLWFGEGIPVDLKEACLWWVVAAEEGSLRGASAREECPGELTAEEWAAVQAEAAGRKK